MHDMSLFEAINTQRAIRRFASDPVPSELVTRVIEAAVRAPSGGNRQPWSFVVVRDAETKRRIGEYYRQAWEAAYGGPKPGRGLSPAVYRSASYLGSHMADAPVLILACIRRGQSGGHGPITRGASIYPAVQNLLLAARALGLGTALTTLHTRYEDEIKALLGIPDDVETAALIPLGYPGEGEHFGGSRRRPASEVTHYERWGQGAAK